MNKTYYFLFGGMACTTYLEAETLDVFKEVYIQEGFSVDLFIFEEGLTTPFELLNAFMGNDAYTCITEEDYNIINQMFN